MVKCFPSFSIVTVCLNAVGTVEQALDSVFSQTFPPFEYIVVDGGSTAGYGIMLTVWR